MSLSFPFTNSNFTCGVAVLTNILLFLKENPYAWGVILFITLLLGFISIKQNIKKKQLSFIVETNYLIKRNEVTIDNLSISYANEQIDNLIISKVALVNNGNITISHDDIPKAAPLCITGGDDCRILSATVIAESNASSLCNVFVENQSTVNISFDYFDKKDGVVLQIIHTGKNRHLNFCGKIKGGEISVPARENASIQSAFIQALISYASKAEISFYTLSALLVILFVLGFLALVGVVNTNSFVANAASTQNSGMDFWIPYGIAFCTYFLVWLFMFSQMRKRKYILPKSLRDFFR